MNHDLIHEYYRNAPLLAEKEQLDLLRTYRTSRCKATREECLDKLVGSLWRFVETIANRLHYVIPIEVARQAGHLGLMVGLKRYSLNKPVRITTYVYWWIRLYIFRAVYKEYFNISVPEYIFRKFNNAIKDLHPRAGHSKAYTSQADLDEIERIIQKIFGQAYSADQARRVFGLYQKHIDYDSCLMAGVLDSCCGKDYPTAIDDKIDIDMAVNRGYDPQTGKLVNEKIAILSEDEHTCIMYYYGLNGKDSLTFKEIGVMVDLTKEAIRQIIERAHKKLKTYMDTENASLGG